VQKKILSRYIKIIVIKKNRDEEELQLMVELLELQLRVILINQEDTSGAKTKIETKTKWGKFADKMDGIFTPEIVKHISTSRKEARDNFIANI